MRRPVACIILSNVLLFILGTGAWGQPCVRYVPTATSYDVFSTCSTDSTLHCRCNDCQDVRSECLR
jgi:hypothetical protein